MYPRHWATFLKSPSIIHPSPKPPENVHPSILLESTDFNLPKPKPKPTFVGVISLILVHFGFSHHWSITTWNPIGIIGFIHPNPQVMGTGVEFTTKSLYVSPTLPLFFSWIFTWKLIPDAASSPCVSKFFSSLKKISWSYQKWTYHSRQFVTTKLPPVGHPKWWVKSKGMPPEMAERFRLRIYNK